MSAAALLASALLLAIAPGGAFGGARLSVQAEVEAIARDLAAGIASGSWAAWERHASDDLLYTTEFGRTMTKQELREAFARAPRAARGALTMSVVGLRSRGDAAVLVYELQTGGDDGIERYRVTDTYWRIGGTWRLAASQAARVVSAEA